MLRSQSDLNVLAENIDLNDIVINKFDAERDYLIYKKMLDNYYDIDITIIQADFDEDIWIFREKVNSRNISFNFNRLEDTLRFFLSNKEICHWKLTIKCWIANLLAEKACDTVRAYFYNLYSAIYATKGFNNLETLLEMINDFTIYRLDENYLKFSKKKATDNTLVIYIKSVVHFFVFYNSEKYLKFVNTLTEYQMKLDNSYTSRKLPSSTDTMIFKKYIEDWYCSLKDSGSQLDKLELIRYYPVYLWWKITSIIPMRVRELILTPRSCLFIKSNVKDEENRYFLTFPRVKREKKGTNRNKHFYDTLPIPLHLYEIIQHYISLTDEFGESEFLFHFQAFLKFNREVEIKYPKEQIFDKDFLCETVGKFYREILHGKYNINLLNINGNYKKILQTNKYTKSNAVGFIDEMIKLGDLRHIAIINMMLQGYDVVEIQRLAGHFSDQTQFNYYNHMNYWVDTEIKRLAVDFIQNTEKPVMEMGNSTIISEEKLFDPKTQSQVSKLYKVSYIRNISEEKHKLTIGFCTDEEMHCPTFNWKHSGCYSCIHWGISVKELETKMHVIEADIKVMYESLKSNINFLHSLYTIQMKEIESYKITNDLEQTANKIDKELIQIAKLVSMLGVYE